MKKRHCWGVETQFVAVGIDGQTDEIGTAFLAFGARPTAVCGIKTVQVFKRGEFSFHLARSAIRKRFSLAIGTQCKEILMTQIGKK